MTSTCLCSRKIIVVIGYEKRSDRNRNDGYVQVRKIKGFYDASIEEVRRYSIEHFGTKELLPSQIPHHPNKLPNGEEVIHVTDDKKIVQGHFLLEMDFFPINGERKGTVRERDVNLVKLE